MGLIQTAKDAVTGMLGDQWREYFYCDSLSEDVLVVKGQKRVTNGKNNNTNGLDNIISNGSIVAVNEGQFMIIVDQGKVIEFCAEPGEFVYDTSTEPSLFYGHLGESIKNTFMQVGKRFTFGGNTGKDQRVYYFNTKEIMGNLFGTANPVPFRVVDSNIGLDVDISIRCNGEYSFKLENPLVFYTNVCANVVDEYNKKKEPLMGQMKAELMTALQPAFAQISAAGIRYSAIPAHTMELSNSLNSILTEQWFERRGIKMVSIAINSLKASEEDEAMIKELQKTAVLRNANMAGATLVSAQADAMRAAASNESTGPMMAFAGMNMANMAGGMNANQLFAMGAQQQAPQNAGNMGFGAPAGAQQAAPAAPAAGTPIIGWTCSCGTQDNTGKFCRECGQPKPAEAGWTCSCGTVNQGKFCQNCGSKKPEGAPIYKCDKCGWEPEDPAHPPKFCPECGDVFDDNDKQ